MSQNSAFCIIISQFDIMENHKISWKNHGILLPGVCMNPVNNKVDLFLQVSTHGYSQNQILVWKYPSLVQIAKLTGHSYRVLYLVSISAIFIM